LVVIHGLDCHRTPSVVEQAKEMLEGMGMGKQASVLGGAGIAGFFASAFR
jgi:hypothetical protein